MERSLNGASLPAQFLQVYGHPEPSLSGNPMQPLAMVASLHAQFLQVYPHSGPSSSGISMQALAKQVRAYHCILDIKPMQENYAARWLTRHGDTARHKSQYDDTLHRAKFDTGEKNTRTKRHEQNTYFPLPCE